MILFTAANGQQIAVTVQDYRVVSRFRACTEHNPAEDLVLEILNQAPPSAYAVRPTRD